MVDIVTQMGPKSKTEAKKWRKEAKKKLEAIQNAFKLNNKK